MTGWDELTVCSECYGSGESHKLSTNLCEVCNGTGSITYLRLVQIENIQSAKIRSAYMLTIKMSIDICGPYDPRILISRGWDEKIVCPSINYTYIGE